MSIEDRVLEVIRENIEDSSLEITLETSLTQDLGLDSLNLIMILNALEDEFDVELDEEEVFKAKNIGEMINKLC